ncbi:hypothetical protein PMAYCL1PPCAC_00331 [Pristionchus mayeri]|uniref:Serine/threonine-protein phosphatase 1 regulatory subunit 10 n=1 Tax=Pristionchus mayeri TaxID=1317129 RepID=A0AAN4YXC2_9BILA|nr:hypothetical protein PMAYCL1PPCAC_00331 [Pristionchus mayeri]
MSSFSISIHYNDLIFSSFPFIRSVSSRLTRSSRSSLQLGQLQMTSMDPFLDQEYEEEDDMGMGGYGGGLPGSSGQPVGAQVLQYSSAPSSSFDAPSNAYYMQPASYEVPTTTFYGSSVQQQPAICTVQPPQLQHNQFMPAMHQPTQYLAPMYDPMQQQQQSHHTPVYMLQRQPGSQQVILQHILPSSHHQQQQQPLYQFEQQHEPMQQQYLQQAQQQSQQSSTQSSSSDHSYASYSDAMGLYDDGSREARSASPMDKRAPVLRDSPAKPVGRMVQKKRSAIEKRVGETDSASAAAVRRIATEEGWKSMNGWLKAAEQDVNKLLQLLGQCREARVTVTLLRSNDTPKFIRKLSKVHKDDEVRALSLSIVTKWKKVVNTTDVVEEKKEKEKKEKKKEEELQEEVEEDENQEMKSRPAPLENRRSSDEGVGGEKKKEVKKEGNRAKAKVYQSKGRSTGLEGDDGAANAAKKRSINETSPQSGAPPAKKSSTEKVPAAGSATTPPPKKSAAAKKITASSSFMDSLLSPAASAQTRKKQLPKKPIPKPDPIRPIAVKGEELPPEPPRGVIDMLLSPNADGKVAMGGLFADTSSSLKEERVPSPPRPVQQSIFVAEEPDIDVGRRKIRFADEHGGTLVETRFFEIEEGERINVNRFTPEEMKHYEAQMENKWMKDNSGMNPEEDDDDADDDTASNPWAMPSQNTAAVEDNASVKWRFFTVAADDLPEVDYGGQSMMKIIQEDRQANSMAAFCPPNERTSHFAEPENLYDVEPAAVDLGLREHPVMIPLEPVPCEEEEQIDGVAMDEPPPADPHQPKQPAIIPTTSQYDSPAEPTPQPAINDKLQALLNGLKTKGLLHDSSAKIVDPYTVPPPIIQHQPVMIPTTQAPPTYFQEQAPMGMNGGFGQQPNRMHIQQEFPGQQPPPGMMQPAMGAAASSSGIQVVNMDVHGPAAGHQPHPGGPDGPFPPYHPGPGRTFFVSQKPCTFFNSPRGCKFGDRCGFTHVLVDPSMNGGGPPGGFHPGMRGNFRGGPPRGGAFRGRGGFGGPPPMHGGNNREGGGRDMDLRRGGGGGNWRDRDERRERRRSRSRSPSPSRRDRGDRSDRSDRGDRDHRSSRREESKDVDLRNSKTESRREPRQASDDDIDGVPIGSSPVA